MNHHQCVEKACPGEIEQSPVVSHSHRVKREIPGVRDSMAAKEGRNTGAALVIALAFVVLLTGLIVAFFSRAMSERQVSNSSANQTKVELFAEGAANTIIADFKEEILAGSVSSVPAPGVTIYMPTAAGTAMPAPALNGTATGMVSFAPNLLKRSAYSQPFYSGSNYNTNFYPSGTRAANISSLSFSQNGRSIPLARWNKSLLLPKANPSSSTDFTPIASGSKAFVAPDWVLVARDGSTPASAGYSSSLAWSGTNSTTIVGRYAYAVYDEGGLLDMNAVGYPAVTGTSQSAYKPSLAYADLAQLTDSTGTTSLLTPAQIDQIVGWRNYASAQPSGTFPGYTFSSGTSYNNFVVSNTKGFLTVGNISLWNGQSDRQFSSRQQLINFITNGVAASGSLANAQNVLQYLGTFSRDINQPSFAPLPASTTPDATHRPAILSGSTGGNDSTGGDDIINPSFLKVRVSSTFARNDGSIAKVGEPLVRKRFAINRLAWLTFKGPIASDNGVLSSDSDVQTIITSLKKAGFTDAFLKQGGPANIYKYFGLSWVPDPKDASQSVWVYSHQGTVPLTTAAPPQANIKTLQGGTNPISGREPDFVELLRAGIAAGAVGKGMYNGGAAGSPDDYNYNRDVKSCQQIIQIVANIIDQFDIDGYPTRILYDDGTVPSVNPVPQEYDGVEDLPYFYRVRGSLMKVQESTPAITSRQTDPTPGTVVSGSEGIGVAFQQPEIWNPHTWNPNATPNNLRPTTFRFTAVTAPPSQTAPSSPDPNAIVTQPLNRYLTASFQSCPLSNAPIKNISWSQDNTALLFDIPTNRPDLFREPTLLIKPSIPTGSNLRLGSQNLLNTETAVAPFLSAGGLKNIVQSPFYTNNGASDNQIYIGVYMGAFPILWNATVSGTAYICNAFYVPGPDGKPVTYRIQYETSPGSGNWVTYDTKFTCVEMNNNANFQTVAGSRPNWIEPAYTIGNDSGRCFSDPRTTRFHVPTCAWNYNTSRQMYEWAPTYSNYGADFNATQKSGAAASTTAYTAGNANTNAAGQNALWSIRPDAFSGFSAYPPSSSLGWYQAGLGSATGSTTFRPGMISQNNPSAKSGGWSANEGVVGQGSAGTQIFFADADNVVRRGMAAYLPPTAADPGDPRVVPAGAASGEPQQVATTYLSASNGLGQWAAPDSSQSPSRPVMLNRPFKTVAELGYVDSGTPWRNLDFSTPESGYAALLDIFCMNDTDDSNGLVAGRVNLNTHQPPVLQAILAGAYKDDASLSTSSPILLSGTGNGAASAIAAALVSRTSDVSGTFGVGSGPLVNISEIVGKWVTTGAALGAWDGGKSYRGFSGVETTTVAPSAPTSGTAAIAPNLSYVLSQDTSANGYTTQVTQRYRESVARALASAGETRVWNLMIDVVAQTGRYPQSVNSLDKFLVESEQRYWVHVAIDRFTGQVIDKQIEVVKE